MSQNTIEPYRTILIDPPWSYEVWNSDFDNRGASEHYDCMPLEAIANIRLGQVADPKGTLLLVWTTAPFLEHTFDVVRGWNKSVPVQPKKKGCRLSATPQFLYKSCIPWMKMTRDAAPRVGLGHHVRSCAEYLLIFTMGKVLAPPVDRRPGCMFSKIGEHSAKPSYQYDIAEAYSMTPYLEVFHRPRDGDMFGSREGWTFIGNEVTGNDINVDLDNLGRLIAGESDEA
jgi:N6-adenosine-specific RNA methylase IME4